MIKIIKKLLCKLKPLKKIIKLSAYTPLGNHVDLEIEKLLKEVINLPISEVPSWKVKHKKGLNRLLPTGEMVRSYTGIGTYTIFPTISAGILLKELISLPLLR